MTNAVLYLGPHTRMREARILCRHRRHFSLFRRAARLAGEVLASSSSPGTPQQLLAVGLFGRLHEATQAGARLAQAGLERDVAVSIRTTFELFVKLRAACADPSFVTRHDDDALVHQQRLAAANIQNPDLQEATKARLARRVEDLNAKIARRGARVLKMEQLAREVGLVAEYATVYRMTSPFVHGSGRTLVDFAYYQSDGRFGGWQFGATDTDADLYLATLTEYLLRAIREIARMLRADAGTQIEVLYRILAALPDESPGGNADREESVDEEDER